MRYDDALLCSSSFDALRSHIRKNETEAIQEVGALLNRVQEKGTTSLDMM